MASLALVLLPTLVVSSTCPSSTATLAYRRQPEHTALHTAVRTQLMAFLVSREVPAFVARAFRKFVSCGILAAGFVRVRCSGCASEMLIAFSCKDRGFCPSCTARRAAETAAHLADDVLPHVAMRQFVLALPFDLHRRVARDEALEAGLLGIFIEELGKLLRILAGSPAGAQPGTITFIQRFSSSLTLHLHFHVLALRSW